MWDLDTLRIMNMPRRRQTREKQAPQNALEVLVGKLTAPAPPSLSVVIAQLRDSEEFGEFINLVREFVPEHERDIMREGTPMGQMEAFASRFEVRYFPLEDAMGNFESYRDLTRAIPVIVSGMSYDDYDGITSDGRPGVQLVTYLLESPYGDENERVALAEACTQYVPQALLQRVPESGILLREQAHTIFDGSRFASVATWGDYITQSTGNFFLDTTYEDLYSGYAPEWDKKEVQGLVTPWQQSERIKQQLNELFDWVEEKPEANFEELLNFALERMREKGGNDGKMSEVRQGN